MRRRHAGNGAGAMNLSHQGGHLVAQIHQRGGRIFARILKRHRLVTITPAHGRILFALWERDGVSISDLVKRTSLSKSALSLTLDVLEKEGFIRRVPSPVDRREVLIRLTEKDRRLRSRYADVSREMAAIAYKGFSDSEIALFEKMLERVLSNLCDFEKADSAGRR